jgi:Frizzled/Smoothened family membrane region
MHKFVALALFLLFLEMSSSQRCQTWRGEPRDFADYVSSKVYVPADETQQTMSEFAFGALASTPILPYECAQRLIEALTLLIFQPCFDVQNATASLRALPPFLGRPPCVEVCLAVRRSCATAAYYVLDYVSDFAINSNSIGVRSLFAWNCSSLSVNVDGHALSFANVNVSVAVDTWPLDNVTTRPPPPPIPRIVHVPCTVGAAESSPIVHQYECPDGLVFDWHVAAAGERPCVLPCPTPSVDVSVRNANFVLLSVLSWLSMLGCLATLVTYVFFAENRQFPRRLTIYISVSVAITMLPLCVNAFYGSTGALVCESATRASTSGWCRAGAALLIVGGLCTLLWFTISALHLLASAALPPRMLDASRRWWVEALCHVVGWLPGAAVGFAALAGADLGNNSALPYCFWRAGLPVYKRWLYFYALELVCLCVVAASVVGALVLLTRAAGSFRVGARPKLRLLLFAVAFFLNGTFFLAFGVVNETNASANASALDDYEQCLQLSWLEPFEECTPPHSDASAALLTLNSLATGSQGLIVLALFGLSSANASLWRSFARGTTFRRRALVYGAGIDDTDTLRHTEQSSLLKATADVYRGHRRNHLPRVIVRRTFVEANRSHAYDAIVDDIQQSDQ